VFVLEPIYECTWVQHMNKLLKTINNVICVIVNIYLLDIVLRKFSKNIMYTWCYEAVSAIGGGTRLVGPLSTPRPTYYVEKSEMDIQAAVRFGILASQNFLLLFWINTYFMCQYWCGLNMVMWRKYCKLVLHNQCNSTISI